MSNDIYMIINMIFLVYYVYKLMIIVCLTCNITLPRRRGSRPDGTRLLYNFYNHINRKDTCGLLLSMNRG